VAAHPAGRSRPMTPRGPENDIRTAARRVNGCRWSVPPSASRSTPPARPAAGRRHATAGQVRHGGRRGAAQIGKRVHRCSSESHSIRLTSGRVPNEAIPLTPPSPSWQVRSVVQPGAGLTRSLAPFWASSEGRIRRSPPPTSRDFGGRSTPPASRTSSSPMRARRTRSSIATSPNTSARAEMPGLGCKVSSRPTVDARPRPPTSSGTSGASSKAAAA
jgi:hypothetical protein